MHKKRINEKMQNQEPEKIYIEHSGWEMGYIERISKRKLRRMH